MLLLARVAVSIPLLRSFIAIAMLACTASLSSGNSVAERAPLPSGRDWPTELFRAGVMQDLAGANQLAGLESFIGTLNASQQTTLRDLLLSAQTPVERFFILKALVAGQPWDRVVEYALRVRSESESEIVALSTARGPQRLPQAWQYSCGPAVVQVALAELDPLAAWRLNEEPAAQDAASQRGVQQRHWLEEYGGVASARGDVSGRGIRLEALLNEKLGRVSGATYVGRRIATLGDGVSEIARILRSGYDVPLCVSWGATDSSESAANHFLLALAARGNGEDTEFQIYEPWTGKTEWVSARTLGRDSLHPILDRFARLTYYYEPLPGGADLRQFILAAANVR